MYFFAFSENFFLAKMPKSLGKTRIYVVIWFGGGSVDRTLRFPGSAEPHRTSKFGRTDPDPERFGRSLGSTVLESHLKGLILQQMLTKYN